MINKKGVDAVVATVLIIMITVAAVAIIWMTVIPMIKTTAEKGTTCFNAATDLEIVKEGSTCANTIGSGKNSMVQISRKANSQVNVTKVDIQWIADGSTVNVTSQQDTPVVNGDKVYEFDMSTATKNFTGVKIVPYVQSGQSVEACDASAIVALPACA